jgi:very-short-patch-repair endonuclease
MDKFWYKSCPDCQSKQSYSTLRAFQKAIKNNRQCRSCKNSGKGNPFFGKEHTEEHRRQLSNIQKQTCSYRYKKQGNNPPKVEKKCLWCDGVFYVCNSRSNAKYCCYEHALNDNFGFSPFKKTKPEIQFENWLLISNIEYKSPYPLGGKLFDFYLPSINTLVEIDGIYWHSRGIPDNQLNETQRRNRINDNRKTCIAKENGYDIIRIWEDEITEKTCIKIFT